MSTKHYINGIEIRPDNAGEIGFKIDFTQDYNLPELNSDSILLSNKAKQLVLDHIEELGVTEGIPYTVVIDGLDPIEYYISLIENPRISSRGDVPLDVRVKRRKSVSNFKTRADDLSFEAINLKSPIPIEIHKYSIVKEDQGVQLIMLTMTLFMFAKELYEGIKGVSEKTSETTSEAIPNTVTVVPSAGVGVKIPGIILAAIKLALQIVYFAAILIQLIILIKKILEILMPPVRNLNVSRIKVLLEKGCEHLGYKFKSNFIDSLPGLTIAPVPLSNPNPSVWEKYAPLDSTIYSKGYPTALDTTPMLGNLIDAVKLMCNGDMRVEDGNVIRIDPNLNDTPTTSIKTTLNLQAERSNEWTYNTGEIWKRYIIKGLYDVSDTHTLDNFQKAQKEVSTEPLTVVNEDLVEIKGLVAVDLPFAYGARKSKLNISETALYTLAKFSDKVTSFFGGGGGMSAKIQGRIGVMQISQQQYSVTKLLYAVGSKQPPNYMDIIGAKAFYEYHKTNQVKENFKKVYTSEIPLSDSKFRAIVNSGNFVKDELTGEDLEILSLSWLDEGFKAEVEYAVKSSEGDNTTTKVIFE